MIKNHPLGEEICEYLRNDTLAIGWMIIPSMYYQSKEKKEEERAKRYEFHLRRGLAIPADLRPRDEREETARKQLYNMDSRQMAGGFNPQITMNVPSKHDTRQSATEENQKKERKSWADWFRGSN